MVDGGFGEPDISLASECRSGYLPLSLEPSRVGLFSRSFRIGGDTPGTYYVATLKWIVSSDGASILIRTRSW
jgi:hypothetical protein